MAVAEMTVPEESRKRLRICRIVIVSRLSLFVEHKVEIIQNPEQV